MHTTHEQVSKGLSLAKITQTTSDQASESDSNSKKTSKIERKFTLSGILKWWNALSEEQRIKVLKDIWAGLPFNAYKILANREVADWGLSDIGQLIEYFIDHHRG